MDKKQLLGRLFELEDQYEVASSTRKKEIDRQIREIGEKLENNPRKQNKIMTLLAKGSDMTFSDVQLLKDFGETKKSILNAMGIKNSSLSKVDISSAEKFYKSLESIKPKKRSGGKTLAKLKLSVEEFVKMKHVYDMSIEAIGREKGVSGASIHYWINKHKDEIEKAIEKRTPIPANIPEPSTVSKVQFDKLQKEYEKLKVDYEDSRRGNLKDLGLWEKQMAEKDEIIKELELKLEDLESQPDPSGEIHDWITRYENEKAAHDHLFKYITILQSAKLDGFIEQSKS